jgi:hypothetical protein
MKRIRQLIVSTVFTVVVSSVALAGDMWTPGLTNPPPTGGGRVTISVSQNDITALDTVAETALLIYQSMLSLF